MQSKTIKKSNPLNYCFLIYFFSFFFFINSPALQASPTKCVQIFYLHNLDLANPSKKFPNLLNAIYLKNLLGHFPNIESHILPIEEYKSGQIEQCFTSFYLGTKSTSTIPQTFYQDFINTKKNVVWINYGIESFNQPLQNIWGVKYQGVSELDPAHLDSHGEPGFYKYFDYKGEVFEKTFQK
ncbi:MAG: hypothetical protein JSS53_09245, partial [Proteobacteria bacterium]|nr:hypothetical protein [Pseudomonadota bacterium]